MRHYVKLKLKGWSYEALERLRTAQFPAMKHPDRSIMDRFLAKTSQLSHIGIDHEYSAEVEYSWPIAPYSQVHSGVVVSVWVEDDKIVLGEAEIADRWEVATTRADWQTQPATARESLDYTRDLLPVEYRYLTLGEYPREQEDKWMLFFENNTLYIHRSLTGIPVFEVEIKPAGDAYRITRAWRAAHPDNPTDANARLLGDLIDWRCSEARRIFDL